MPVLVQKTALYSLCVASLRLVRAAVKPLYCSEPVMAVKMASIPTMP